MLLATGGCGVAGNQRGSDGHGAVSDLHRGFIQELRQRPGLSDLQRQVIEDYWITDAELAAIQQVFLDCVYQGHPEIEITFEAGGGYTVRSRGVFVSNEIDFEASMEKEDKIVTECQLAHLTWIPWLFYDMRANPDGLTEDEAILHCFRSKGLQEGDSLTVDTLQDTIHEEWMLDGWVNFPSEEHEACWLDPFGAVVGRD